ncbi:MAG: prepilin-type N-terminal cleavage/methylation domain-containing protein [Gammaproteobacteria bacterium]|nr:MAG: prepilin-type N-terminal cleavage/methylation domain-containing protein [Gammaproteobacteria bacterium]
MNNINIKQISGFTLLELMVTIAVMVIIATVGVPAFRTTIANSNIEASANNLRNTLVAARNKAIETGSRVTVNKGDSSDWNSWKIGSGQSHSANNTVSVLGKTSSDSAITDITFTDDGSLSGETLEYQVFSLCYSGDLESIKPKAVVVSPGGLVLIKDQVQLIDLSISCPAN